MWKFIEQLVSISRGIAPGKVTKPVTREMISHGLYRQGGQPALIRRALSSSVDSSTNGKATQIEGVDIVFGSQTGTAQMFSEMCAEEVKQLLHKHQLSDQMGEPQLKSMDDFGTYQDLEDVAQKNKILLCFISNFGRGEPPDNARKFYTSVVEENANKSLQSPQLHAAVFGLGNSSYIMNYQKTGKELTKALDSLGVQLLCERGEGDDAGDIEDAYETWSSEKLIPALEQLLTAQAPATADAAEEEPVAGEEASQRLVEKQQQQQQQQQPAVEQQQQSFFFVENPESVASIVEKSWNVLSTNPESEQAQPEMFYQDYPLSCPLTSTRELQDPNSSVKIRKLDFNTNRRLPYRTGDYVGVWPVNDPTVVEDLLEYLSTGETALASNESLHQHPIDTTKKKRFASPYFSWPAPSLSELLSRRVSLTSIPRRTFLRRLRAHSQDTGSQEELEELIAADSGTVKKHLAGYSTADLLRKFHYDPSKWAELLNDLPPQTPRFYSIASSPIADPENLSVIVGRAKCFREDVPLAEKISLPEFEYLSGVEQPGIGGVCSSFLHRLQTGDTADLFVQEASAFWLPKDRGLPLVLAGAGTGFAPLHGMLQEREHLWRVEEHHASLGKCWVLLGLRSQEDLNEYFGKYLESLINDGIVDGAIMATSHDQRLQVFNSEKSHFLNDPEAMSNKLPLPGPFIHHELAQKQEMWKQLHHALQHEDAHVYLCGHRAFGKSMQTCIGWIMAKDHLESSEIAKFGTISSHTMTWPPPPSEGREGLDRLEQENRWHVDVFE